MQVHKLGQKLLILKPTVWYTARYVSTQNLFADPPSSAKYDSLINKAGRDRDWGTVQNLLMKRARDGCFCTNDTFKFISTDHSVLEDLLNVLSDLSRGFPKKNAHDCIINQLSKLHRIADALRVAEIMVQKNYGATACTFHPILIHLTKQKRVDEARHVMQLMRDYGIKPDRTSYNYLLTAHCFSGDLTSAANLLTKMEDDGMGADSRTYDALVLGACRAGRINGALKVLRRMLDDGVPALYSTHVHVISAMMRNGYYAQAVEFVLSYAGKDKQLDYENFGILANRLIKLNRLDDAKFVLKKMKERGIKMGEKLQEFYGCNVAE